MSIVAAVFIPEGIILAGDSRLTRKRDEVENGKTVKKEFTLTDNAQKVMLLSKVPVGIAFCGDAIIEGNTVADYIRLFEINKVEKTDTVETIATKLHAHIAGKDVNFFVCGYLNDVPYVYSVNKNCKRENLNSSGNVAYSIAWKGQTTPIDRLINTDPHTDIRWSLMPLKDGIDLAEFIVDLTIKYERFQDDIQTCGGPIDILVIDKDRAFWYKHKTYKPNP